MDNGTSVVRWRFLLAFQCFPALLLLAGIKFLPDSPRYLASVRRFEEAKEVYATILAIVMILIGYRFWNMYEAPPGLKLKGSFLKYALLLRTRSPALPHSLPKYSSEEPLMEHILGDGHGSVSGFRSWHHGRALQQ